MAEASPVMPLPTFFNKNVIFIDINCNNRYYEPQKGYLMSDKAINLLDKFKLFDELWSPKVIGDMNDYQVKVAWFENEFVWHDHTESDELFILLEGEMNIHLEDGRTVELKSGDMYIVPKGVRHKPVATVKSKVLLIEPKGTINTGKEGGALTAQNDIRL